MSWSDEEIFSRQTALPEIGTLGQECLRKSSVLVVGLGGLGCASLPYLAAGGIGRIGLLDFDKIEPSNLPRQILYGEADVGQWKADVANRQLQRQYPKTQFEPHKLVVEEAELSTYDLILDATDRSSARYFINDACRSLNKPWIYGSIHEWQGQAAFFSPASDYRTLFPNASRSPLHTCATGGVLGPLAGCIGSIQALEAIQFLATGTSRLMNKLIVLDTKLWKFQLFELSDSDEQNRSIDVTLNNASICLGLHQLQALLEEETVCLIDAARPFSIAELPKLKKIIFHCTSGIRSAAAAQRLRLEGFEAYFLGSQINE